MIHPGASYPMTGQISVKHLSNRILDIILHNRPKAIQYRNNQYNSLITNWLYMVIQINDDTI